MLVSSFINYITRFEIKNCSRFELVLKQNIKREETLSWILEQYLEKRVLERD